MKKFFNKRNVILKSLVISFLVILSTFFLYIWSIINEAQLEINTKKMQVFTEMDGTTYKNAPHLINPIELESDSIVQKSDLEDFFVVSTNKRNFGHWYSEKIEKGILTPGFNGTDLYIKQNFILDPLKENSCTEIYCLQFRVPFVEIPGHLWKGLIGIEDYRFLEHPGVDWPSLLRALVKNMQKGGLVQGGSTLTQQLVKNLFLTNEKSLSRKFREMIYSFYLELHLSKEQILGAYFNEVYWGVLQGIKVKGIFAASIAFFNKRPADLDPFEVAILIGMLKGPHLYRPLSSLARLKDRVNVVFNRFIDLNLISNESGVLAWSDSKWNAWKQDLEKRESKKSLYYIWETISELNIIESKQNYPMNEYEVYILKKAIRELKVKIRDKMQGLDFRVKIIAGKAFCSDQVNCPKYMYYDKYERSLQKAIVEEKHLIGSILKPILYQIFISLGKKLSELVRTEPVPFSLKSGKWTSRETKRNLPSEVTLLDALKLSLNNPVLRIANELGLATIQDILIKLIPRLKIPLNEFPAQLLGGIEMSLHEVFLLYTQFIQKECDLRYKSQRSEDDLQFESRKRPSEMEDPNISNGVIDILSGLSNAHATTIKNSVNEQLGATSFFGKTGTSNNGWDNWYVAYNGSELYVIWFGVDGSRNNRMQSPFYGSNTSFQIFQRLMTYRGKRFSELFCSSDIAKI